MSCIRASGLAVAIFATAALPAAAQSGFFDQLFGGQPQPFFGFPRYEGEPAMPMRRHPHRAKAVADEMPIRQMPTDLMHDKTLRYGDAVMMESGLKVFTGERAGVHAREDFSPLEEARIRPGEKIALEALDASNASGEVVSGRSSSSFKTTPIAKGEMIHDPSGKLIRYVGP